MPYEGGKARKYPEETVPEGSLADTLKKKKWHHSG
jgi:hypothetical protein